MRHRPAILSELITTQPVNIIDTFHRPREHVRSELLIAKDRKTFLKTELKPVAAGHTIARPVVKIFVGDDALDANKVSIGGGIGTRQHVLRVEDIEPFILHRPHVEVIHRHDHVDVEIIFTAIDLLIPTHGAFKRVHRVATFVKIVPLHIDTQHHLTAAHGGKTVLDELQLPRHQRK